MAGILRVPASVNQFCEAVYVTASVEIFARLGGCFQKVTVNLFCSSESSEELDPRHRSDEQSGGMWMGWARWVCPHVFFLFFIN